jgi:hypothetical protein
MVLDPSSTYAAACSDVEPLCKSFLLSKYNVLPLFLSNAFEGIEKVGGTKNYIFPTPTSV